MYHANIVVFENHVPARKLYGRHVAADAIALSYRTGLHADGGVVVVHGNHPQARLDTGGVTGQAIVIVGLLVTNNLLMRVVAGDAVLDQDRRDVLQEPDRLVVGEGRDGDHQGQQERR